jgi:hypothetical protein
MDQSDFHVTKDVCCCMLTSEMKMIILLIHQAETAVTKEVNKGFAVFLDSIAAHQSIVITTPLKE